MAGRGAASSSSSVSGTSTSYSDSTIQPMTAPKNRMPPMIRYHNPKIRPTTAKIKPSPMPAGHIEALGK